MTATKVLYTKTDEAPALATYSFLPIVQAFTQSAGIVLETRDISLAARILVQFEDYLSEVQRVKDDLSELGKLAKMPEANIIKLPNISASVPQLVATIKELQDKGYPIPDYPYTPANDLEEMIRKRYDKVKGSAVNPVLREGNSDRRAPRAVKEFAKINPHKMGEWSSDSKTHVTHMEGHDFFSNEQSRTMDKESRLSVYLKRPDGSVKILKEGISTLDGEVVDATLMEKEALVQFLKSSFREAGESGILLSLHLKATMMKVSDPIIFGHAVRVYYHELFERHGDVLARIGFNPNNGLGDLVNKWADIPDKDRQALELTLEHIYTNGPDLFMVDSDKGITNLHVPSDVIIDASMPAMIRSSGKGWDKNGNTRDTKAVIPDKSYAPIYQVVIEDCQRNGAFDPATMGTVPNVGLMAQKAEEYGSHDKTFEILEAGTVEVLNEEGEVLFTHEAKPGDIWRMCQVKDEPVKNWVQLAVDRARATGWPAVFWLDQDRAHDRELIIKVNLYLSDIASEDVQLHIMSPAKAMAFTLDRIRKGENTISVTGNVLRDYLTDLFPILEVGTSAKMLSIVPLMNGGRLFETGAGGSAPKHVQQFVKEGHLRWDSLGEFLALTVSLEHLANKDNNSSASVLSDALDRATGDYLKNGKTPSRKVNELDTRGSHYFLARYWAEALATQHEDEPLREKFSRVAEAFKENEDAILTELIDAQGSPVDLGGYYYPQTEKVLRAMRPSPTLNKIIDSI